MSWNSLSRSTSGLLDWAERLGAVRLPTGSLRLPENGPAIPELDAPMLGLLADLKREGLIQAAGVNHTLNDQMGNGMGYTAVAIAYMAQMEPAAIVVVSFLFSILLQGSSYMQISMQIPSATGDVIQGIILLFILGSEFFSRYRVTWDRKEKEAAK